MTRVGHGVCAMLMLMASCDRDRQLLWETPHPATSTGGAGGGDVLVEPVGGGRPTPIPPTMTTLECKAEVGCDCPSFTSCACSTTDDPNALCGMSCSMGDCFLTCRSSSACDLRCAFGCSIVCESFSACTVNCDSGCALYCAANAYCQAWSMMGPIDMYCEEGAVCECPIQTSCTCSGPGCPPDQPPMP